MLAISKALKGVVEEIQRTWLKSWTPTTAKTNVVHNKIPPVYMANLTDFSKDKNRLYRGTVIGKWRKESPSKGIRNNVGETGEDDPEMSSYVVVPTQTIVTMPSKKVSDGIRK
mmetsp:Transcript_6003/g.11402  ORF Transcript_6003/g.11402 Transcript_6003/m.11402 type:complete len:113 (+) Transcript_6003:1534-1872(+)